MSTPAKQTRSATTVAEGLLATIKALPVRERTRLLRLIAHDPDLRQHDSPRIVIAGESFQAYREGTVVWIQHPLWSLTGTGASTAEAVIDLYREATLVAPVYLSTPATALSGEARRMASFLRKLLRHG